MSDCHEQSLELRALAMRVAALEDNVAFLEQWCEEQQDVLDRIAGPVAFDYELEAPPPPRQILRVVDLRDGADDDDGAESPEGPPEVEFETLVAVVDTEHDRRVRQLKAGLNRLRRRLALSVAPPADGTGRQRPDAGSPPLPPLPPPPAAPAIRRVSAKQAGRTAP
jgi:hypothetical protein